jgi:hypothetical protein
MQRFSYPAIFLALSFASSVHAFYEPAASSTLGSSSTGWHLSGVVHNPAVGIISLGENAKYRGSYLPSFGAKFEIGDFDNFSEEVDELTDLLDGKGILLEDVGSTLLRFNNLLGDLGQKGSVKGTAYASLPITPLIFSLGDQKAVSVQFDTFAQFRGNVLTSKTTSCGEFLCFNPNNNSYDTKTSLYLKGVKGYQLGVGYSQWLRSISFGPIAGELYAGTKLNLYSLSLSKQVIPLKGLDGKDVSDVIQDDYDTNEVSSTQLGLDAGLVLKSQNYQLGFTLENINQPKFDYGVLGQNCSQLTGFVADKCFQADDFADRGIISASESHQMQALATVDGQYWVGPRWALGASLELTDHYDPVGDIKQMMSISTSHLSTHRWIPDWRLGYHKDMKGQKLSYMAAGTRILQVLNLDLLYGLEKTLVDGDSYPRIFGFAVSVDQRF